MRSVQKYLSSAMGIRSGNGVFGIYVYILMALQHELACFLIAEYRFLVFETNVYPS